jgi:plasmid replication initiation protein
MTFRRFAVDALGAAQHPYNRLISGCSTMTDPSDQLSFALDSPLIGKVKSDRTVMVFNFFSLSRDPVSELPVFEDATLGVQIEVRAKGTGVATIWDKEVLIYIASLMQEKMNRGEPVGQRFTFTAHDFFRVCHIDPGGSGYARLAGALKRLQGTQIETNIETGGEGETGAFSWIENYKIAYRRDRDTGGKVMKAITVTLCDWLYRAVLKNGQMLTYHPDYFDLAPLERRLYEIARAHCGNQSSFKMNIEKLRRRVGSDMELKAFKHKLLKLQGKKMALPDYYFLLGYQGKVLSSDGPNPRVPLKAIYVMFGRLDRMTSLTFKDAPVVGDFPVGDL